MPEVNLSTVVLAVILTVGALVIFTHLTSVEPTAVEFPDAYKKNVAAIPAEVANAPLEIENPVLYDNPKVDPNPES